MSSLRLLSGFILASLILAFVNGFTDEKLDELVAGFCAADQDLKVKIAACFVETPETAIIEVACRKQIAPDASEAEFHDLVCKEGSDAVKKLNVCVREKAQTAGIDIDAQVEKITACIEPLIK